MTEPLIVGNLYITTAHFVTDRLVGCPKGTTLFVLKVKSSLDTESVLYTFLDDKGSVIYKTVYFTQLTPFLQTTFKLCSRALNNTERS